MDDTLRIPTTEAVYWAIYSAHKDDLAVFSSYTTETSAFTQWGFRGADFPSFGAETTWEADYSDGHFPVPRRVNEKSTYWLCVGRKDDDAER